MQKKFFSNLFFIVLLNLLIKPLYIFGIDVQVQNTVGAADYGLYFSLLNFSFLLNIFLDIGVTNYNTKNTAQNPNTLSKYIGSFFGLKIMLGVLYAFITIGFALILGYSDHEMYLLSFFILNQIFVGLILYLRSNFAGLHQFKIDAILSVLDRFLLIIITATLLMGVWTDLTFKIEWFVYAQTFSYGITLIIGIILTRLRISRISLKTNKILSFAILRKSVPFAVLILLMMLYTRIDAVMLERLLPDGKHQAGVYAQGFRLLDAVNMFAFLVAGLLLPIFSRLISEKTSVLPILQSAGKFLVGSAFVIGITLAWNTNEIIDFIYAERYDNSAEVFCWLILSFVPMSFSHIFGTLLTANNNLKLLNKMALLGVLLNIILNYFLIPEMKAEGAAIATITTQSLTALMQIILAIKVFKLKIDWKSLLRFVFLLSIFIPVTHFLHQEIGKLWSILVTVLVGVGLLFMLKLIHIKTLLTMLKSKAE
ncbi:oligosaccharide flippase family protein [Brumimicrobium salinarum]|nr:oligosaccharide flippase family protein [Brumimicrobium salinarum]